MRRFRVKIDDEVFEVEVEEIGQGVEREAVARKPVVSPSQPPALPQKPAVTPKPAATPAPKPAQAGAGDDTAPIPGVITEIKVAAGASVKKGDILLLLEAMKMQNEILAPFDATVTEVLVSQGATVQTGDVLIRLDS